jgi:F-type H+-transporting ATPase subunit b
VRDLRSEIGTLAVDLASKIVGEALADEARRQGTVERFIDELGAAGSAGGRR